MKYDTILLAGDRHASKNVFGMNKSLMEMNGIPLFIYILSALQDIEEVDTIYIVGPKSKIDELIEKYSNKLTMTKNLIVAEQRANLYENIWHTFLLTIDGYRNGDEQRNPVLLDKAVLVLPADMPLVTSFEIEEFLSKSDMVNYDYCIGMTSEDILKNYYPSDKRPGLKLAYLHLRENKYRISNLHLVKPFRVENRGYIEKMYEYRYQKDVRNIIGLTIELIKKHAGFKSLFLYSMVQMSLFLSHIHLESLSYFFRWFVPVKLAERIISDVLKTRLKMVETSFGGAALDVDSERDFNVIKVMHGEWMDYQKNRSQESGAPIQWMGRRSQESEVRSQKSEARGKKLFLFCLLSTVYCLLSADYAYAWGAGLHIKEGIFILNNLKLILPHIADVLRAFPHDYLYGCISADIFIGKGHRRRDDHCHNWSIGQRMLKLADREEIIAFSYGYLSHLAADVIAHNFYIPNQLYLTSSTRRFGHIYWEFRSDEYIEKRYWRIAKGVINRHNSHNDEFMQEIIKKKIISFNTKKQIYSQTINVNDIALWQKAVAMVSKNSRWDVEKKYIEYLNRLSVNMIINLLNNPGSSICFQYDPVGTDNLLASKRRRRIDIVLNGRYPIKKVFNIPQDILRLSFI
ncbi:MAG: zinc dependent phospholipase C family protein [Nitrospinae bacterium]|nr:zinc dependent phospholipase C family protein [Nitrospinota bacterium]